MSIANLPNLGPKSAEMLAAAGIVTRQQLEELGAVRAYLAARQAGAKPGLNLLWAIAGALSNTHWAKLSTESKNRLLAELEEITSESA